MLAWLFGANMNHYRQLVERWNTRERDDGLIFQQTMALMRNKLVNKHQLLTDIRAIIGITIVKVEEGSSHEVGSEKELSIVIFKFEPYNVPPRQFIRDKIIPQLQKISSIINFKFIGSPKPYEVSK